MSKSKFREIWLTFKQIKQRKADKTQRNKIVLIGNDNLQNADYIFTNYIYEVNVKFNDKYKIPKNFKLYKSLEKNDTLIYSIYKKK